MKKSLWTYQGPQWPVPEVQGLHGAGTMYLRDDLSLCDPDIPEQSLLTRLTYGRQTFSQKVDCAVNSFPKILKWLTLTPCKKTNSSLESQYINQAISCTGYGLHVSAERHKIKCKWFKKSLPIISRNIPHFEENFSNQCKFLMYSLLRSNSNTIRKTISYTRHIYLYCKLQWWCIHDD